MTDNVVFDMDGVIFDSERLYIKAWHIVGPLYGLNDIDTYLRCCIGRNAADIRAYIISRNGADFPADQLAADIRAAIEDIIDREGLPLKPGVREILYWLRSHERKIALATSSGADVAERYLQSTGLKRFFDVVVTGDMITRGKPAPDIYLLACEKLNTPPEQCYAIEDSPSGIRSAHTAGMKPVLVPDVVEVPEETEKLAYKKFNSLLEVNEYFIFPQTDPATQSSS